MILPEIAQAVSAMMANRSDRHFPNLSPDEAREATRVMRSKVRGFHQGQGCKLSPQQKAGYM